jgi:hypothetical protein
MLNSSEINHEETKKIKDRGSKVEHRLIIEDAA